MGTLTFGELFAGVGGFSLGFERAGWECLWQVEWDNNCQSVLERNWPSVERYADVRDCEGHGMAPVDCITFGSPCQDLSVAGKRAGLAGERSGLFHEAIRVITEVRNATANAFPRFAVWENVPGALSSNGGDDFRTVLRAFAEIGALDITWRVVDAQHFGIPQRRRRILVVADFAGECAGALHAEPAGVLWHPPAGGTTWQTSAGSFGVSIAGTLGSTTGGFRTTDLDGIGAPVSTGQAYSRSSFGGYTAGVGSLSATDYKRPDMHIVSTFPAVRRLTPLECERLLGFPDNHTRWRADGTEQADTQRYRQCGNGVAAPVAAWLAWNLRTALENEHTNEMGNNGST